MSLSPRKSAAKRIRKQLKKRIESALQTSSKKHLSDTDVHEVRKALKKARASLRLLRPGLRNSDYRLENSRLREAARPLGPIRDAKVLPETLRKLARHYGTPLRALNVQLKPQAGSFDLAHSCRLLREARAHLERLDVHDDNWSLVGPALKEIYRRGRRALACAHAASTPQAFHEWRKQAKYLRYTLETLEPLWPPVIHTLAEEAHQLTNYLGDDHDLSVFSQQPAREVTLHTMIEHWQIELRHEAVALGTKLYKEKPAVFTRRFGRYWRAWRG
ncbi:MAG: CHAD domain-containing protein [Proteobacteria bacterium]|nr:CHAD domain-containing protein [Pseudomonadota bacterium]